MEKKNKSSESAPVQPISHNQQWVNEGASQSINSSPMEISGTYNGSFGKNYVAYRMPEDMVRKIREERRNSKKWSIISLVTATISVMVFCCCLIASGGRGISESGPGSIWVLWGIYMYPIGTLLIVTSVVCGIRGLRTQLKWPAIAGLILGILTPIIILAFFISIGFGRNMIPS